MVHKHPISGVEVRGVRLGWGGTVEEGDVYDSTDGTWRAMPCTGATVYDGCKTIIIRPENLVPPNYTLDPNNTLGFDVFAHERANGAPKGAPSFYIKQKTLFGVFCF